MNDQSNGRSQNHLCGILKLSTLAFLTLMLFSAHSIARAQQDFSKVEIKVTKVAGSVYMLEGAGGNIGASIGEDGILIVDDQFAPLVPKIKEALKNISNKPIKFVLNTHFHGDHTGGNSKLGSEATIVAHENVRKRLSESGTAGGNPGDPSSREGLPVITFNDRATVHLNGEDIRAIHVPRGHTDGDSIIYFSESNVAHLGDDFVTYGFPFVDVKSGGSVSGMIAGLENVLKLLPRDVKIIPGHGPLSGPADVQKFIDMLKDTRALVAAAAKEGKSVDEMKKDHLLAKYEDLGKAFIKTDAWIELLFSEITKPGR